MDSPTPCLLPCSCPQHCPINQSPSLILSPKCHWIPQSPDLSPGLSIAYLGPPTNALSDLLASCLALSNPS